LNDRDDYFLHVEMFLFIKRVIKGHQLNTLSHQNPLLRTSTLRIYHQWWSPRAGHSNWWVKLNFPLL